MKEIRNFKAARNAAAHIDEKKITNFDQLWLGKCLENVGLDKYQSDFVLKEVAKIVQQEIIWYRPIFKSDSILKILTYLRNCHLRPEFLIFSQRV